MQQLTEFSEAIHDQGAKILKFECIQSLTVDDPIEALYEKTVEPGKYVILEARIAIPVKT